jgi:hypothetical protein
VKRGDLVKFAKDHSTRDGLEYCADWLGVIVALNDKTVDIQWFDTTNTLELRASSQYDEQWWNTLDYEPFEVVSES